MWLSRLFKRRVIFFVGYTVPDIQEDSVVVTMTYKDKVGNIHTIERR